MSNRSKFSNSISLAGMCAAYVIAATVAAYVVLSAFVSAAGAQEHPRFVFRGQTTGVLGLPGSGGNGGGAPETPAPGDSAPGDNDGSEDEDTPPVRESAAPSDIEVRRVSDGIEYQVPPELLGGDRLTVRFSATNTNENLTAIAPRFEVDFGEFGNVAAICGDDEIAPYGETECTASRVLTQSEVDALEVHEVHIYNYYHAVGPFAVELRHLDGEAVTGYRYTDGFEEHISLMALLRMGTHLVTTLGDIIINRANPDPENPERVQAGDTITLSVTVENTAVHPARSFMSSFGISNLLHFQGFLPSNCPVYIPAGETISCATTLTLTEEHMTGRRINVAGNLSASVYVQQADPPISHDPIKRWPEQYIVLGH